LQTDRDLEVRLEHDPALARPRSSILEHDDVVWLICALENPILTSYPGPIHNHLLHIVKKEKEPGVERPQGLPQLGGRCLAVAQHESSSAVTNQSDLGRRVFSHFGVDEIADTEVELARDHLRILGDFEYRLEPNTEESDFPKFVTLAC